jgi:hypothetical protein
MFIVVLEKRRRLDCSFDYIVISCIIHFVKTVKGKITTVDDTQFFATNSCDYLFGWGESAFNGE